MLAETALPVVETFASPQAEAAAVRSSIERWMEEGTEPYEIGVFVRTTDLVERARMAIDGIEGASAITTAQMSLAKGLEFRAVAVMACDEGALPLDDRVADAADEAELDDIYETERRLGTNKKHYRHLRPEYLAILSTAWKRFGPTSVVTPMRICETSVIPKSSI